MPFEEVSAAGASQLDHAALEGDDVELWLIRCPPGFDPSELHDRKVDLTREDSTPIGTGSQATGYCLRPIPACESAGVVGVFPSARRKRWLIGKPVTQQFAVSLAPSAVAAAGASSAAPTPLPLVPQVQGLRLRHAFVGAVPPPPAATPAAEGGGRKRAAEESVSGESKKKAKKKSEGGGGGSEAKEPSKKKAKKSGAAVQRSSVA
jgi:hypothetical protein